MDQPGVYEIKGVPPGKYTLKVTAPGFTIFVKQNVEIAAGQTQKLDVALKLNTQVEKVTVTDQSVAVDVSPTNNAGAVVITGKDLDALSDDPDELQADLEALAGPAAGPNGGQMYIDGFTAGQLPPKSSIREIRINSNPFSAEYDRMGFGRIEIFTKPGTDKFHGNFMVMGNDSSFNSKNPFVPVSTQPGYDSTQFGGSIGGPITKHSSFFFNAERRTIGDISIVNATVLDPSFNIIPFTQGVANPRTRLNLSPRFDIQLAKNNYLTVRYQFFRNNEVNNGIGTFSLPSQGMNSLSTEHQVQIGDTQNFGEHVVNETRFQFIRSSSSSIAQTLGTSINVVGAFNGGGNSAGTNATNTNRYEFQNYTSVLRGKHFLKFGARVRTSTEGNSTTSDFNGVFSFTGGTIAATGAPVLAINAYQITQQGLSLGLTPAQIRANGGGASQFSITSGTPLANVSLTDAGLYAQDDWRLKPNLTLSAGLRFETQTRISDHADWAPRIGFAWAIGGHGKTPPKTVIRGGYGMFFDRFSQDLVLEALRFNGVTQQQFIVTNPDFFPTVPSISSLSGAQTLPTTYRIDPRLRAPYVMQGAASIERQLSKYANLSVTYIDSRGEHQFLTNAINAPLPGTYPPGNPTVGTRPLGNIGNVYEYQSNGVFRQHQLVFNTSVRMGTHLTVTGFYSLGYAHSDTAGAGYIPMNPYNLLEDYGRASFDVRHRVTVIGTISLPYGFRLSPFMLFASGSPFNFSVGKDLFGTAVFNSRPAFLSSATCSTVTVTAATQSACTPLGTFALVPTPGQTIVPINFGNGPDHFSLNMRVSKTFGFGPKIERPAGQGQRGQGGGGGGRGGPGGGGPGGGGGGGGPRGGGGGAGGPGGGPFGNAGGGGGFGGGAANYRYNLTFSANFRNLFNNINVANPIGNLNSPDFAKSIALIGGGGGGQFANGPAPRKIELQLSFTF
jgi:hypothetical protein